jgi:glyceraldehyde-3-phosphate dehydrogenase (NAD(P))
MKDRIPIIIIGFGSQGRRVTEAIARQPDMKVIGVALSQLDLSAHLAFRIGYPIFSMEPQAKSAFKRAEIPCEGSIETLMPKVKAVVDCAPAGVGKQNKEKFYQKYGLSVVFQAGENPTVAEIPAFFSLKDFERARAAKFVRVASPFAVSLGRTLWLLYQKCKAKRIFCTFVRAGSETMRANQGPVDTIIPDSSTNLQGIKRELNQIFGELEFLLSSVKVPSILFDVQSIFLELGKKVRLDIVDDLLSKTPRVALVSGEAGLSSTDSLFEFYRRLRPFQATCMRYVFGKNRLKFMETC